MTTALIAGIPRSGTSFACACLNTLPDCVALVEPMGGMPRASDNLGAAKEIIAFARSMRASLLSDGFAPSATVGGDIPDNTFEEPRADGGVRRTHFTLANVAVTKPLSPDFRLFIKHPGTFTALAEELAPRIALYAIVRHPVAVLASWQSVDIPIREGWWPPAEAFSPDLQARLRAVDDPLTRQVALLQWIFQVYRQLPRGHVLTYESIVRHPAEALAGLSGSTAPIAHPARQFDERTRYPWADFRAYAEALAKIEADVEAERAGSGAVRAGVGIRGLRRTRRGPGPCA